MIAWVEGTLMRRAPEATVLLGGGLAVDVLVPVRAVEGLPAVGHPVRLWTHLAVREDAWTLFGFPTTDEREMFRLLIGVNGIGPRVALGMLSGASADAIARHLRAGDEKSLARLPGIGKKTAARLVVELGQRVPETLAGGSVAAAGAGETDGSRDALGEALAILGAMGLPAVQAERALHAARTDQPDVEHDLQRWVKTALRHL
ncbi:MAG: Holliday junction branch migration protein RuvA [Candidatus Krumholzibacteriia bacterium]